jgi:membrane protein YdbS with pleckstrin-like domain
MDLHFVLIMIVSVFIVDLVKHHNFTSDISKYTWKVTIGIYFIKQIQY